MSALGAILLGATLLLGALGGMYQCIYDQGYKGKEDENLRVIIAFEVEAGELTSEGYAAVSAELADEKEQTTALRAEIDRIGNLPPPDPITVEVEVPTDDGVCKWQDRLPWPS